MRKLAIAIILAVLFGCTSAPKKEYVAPEDPSVQECIGDCQSNKTQCAAYAHDQYRRCRHDYEYRERVYRDCVARGGTFCIKPESCKPPRTSYCQDQYDGCYQACGGIIRTIEPEAG